MNGSQSESIDTAPVSSNSTISCQLAKNVLTPEIKGVAIGELITTPFAVVPNVLLLYAIYGTRIFPLNLRIILGYFATTFLLFAFTTLIRSLYTLLSPPCSFAFTARSCSFFLMATTSMIVPNLYFCCLSLCIERLYATLRFRHYDKNTKPWLGCLVVFASVSVMSYIYGDDPWLASDKDRVPFCDGAFLSQRSPYLMPGYMALECAIVGITVFVYFYNRYVASNMAINRARYDLSARFLVQQNIQVNAIVLPSIALHFAAHIPMIILLIPTSSMNLVDARTKALITRSTFLWRLIYAVADPLVAFYVNRHLRHSLEQSSFGRIMKNFGMSVSKIRPHHPTPAECEAVVHFDYINKLWAGPVPAKVQ